MKKGFFLISCSGNEQLISERSGQLLKQLTDEVLPWKRPGAVIPSQVSLAVKLVHYGSSDFATMSKWTFPNRPFFFIYWLACSDLEVYKTTERERLVSWFASLRDAGINDWLIVYDTSVVGPSKQRTMVLERIRVDFKNYNDKILEFDAAASRWSSLVTTLRHAFLTTLTDVYITFQKLLQSEKEKYLNVNWHFYDYAVLQMELAAIFFGMELYDEVLAQLDEMDALLSLLISNAASFKDTENFPAWLDAATKQDSLCAPCFLWYYKSHAEDFCRSLASRSISYLEFRSYVFCCEITSLLAQQRQKVQRSRARTAASVAETELQYCSAVLDYGYHFLSTVRSELAVLKVPFARHKQLVFASLLCLEVLAFARRLADLDKALNAAFPLTNMYSDLCCQLIELHSLLFTKPENASIVHELLCWLPSEANLKQQQDSVDGLVDSPATTMREMCESKDVFDRVVIKTFETALALVKHFEQEKQRMLASKEAEPTRSALLSQEPRQTRRALALMKKLADFHYELGQHQHVAADLYVKLDRYYEKEHWHWPVLRVNFLTEICNRLKDSSVHRKSFLKFLLALASGFSDPLSGRELIGLDQRRAYCESFLRASEKPSEPGNCGDESSPLVLSQCPALLLTDLGFLNDSGESTTAETELAKSKTALVGDVLELVLKFKCNLLASFNASIRVCFGNAATSSGDNKRPLHEMVSSSNELIHNYLTTSTAIVHEGSTQPVISIPHKIDLRSASVGSLACGGGHCSCPITSMKHVRQCSMPFYAASEAEDIPVLPSENVVVLSCKICNFGRFAAQHLHLCVNDVDVAYRICTANVDQTVLIDVPRVEPTLQMESVANLCMGLQQVLSFKFSAGSFGSSDAPILTFAALTNGLLFLPGAPKTEVGEDGAASSRPETEQQNFESEVQRALPSLAPLAETSVQVHCIARVTDLTVDKTKPFEFVVRYLSYTWKFSLEFIVPFHLNVAVKPVGPKKLVVVSIRNTLSVTTSTLLLRDCVLKCTPCNFCHLNCLIGSSENIELVPNAVASLVWEAKLNDILDAGNPEGNANVEGLLTFRYSVVDPVREPDANQRTDVMQSFEQTVALNDLKQIGYEISCTVNVAQEGATLCRVDSYCYASIHLRSLSGIPAESSLMLEIVGYEDCWFIPDKVVLLNFKESSTAQVTVAVVPKRVGYIPLPTCKLWYLRCTEAGKEAVKSEVPVSQIFQPTGGKQMYVLQAQAPTLPKNFSSSALTKPVLELDL